MSRDEYPIMIPAIGDRVRIHPASDWFVRGATYARVTSYVRYHPWPRLAWGSLMTDTESNNAVTLQDVPFVGVQDYAIMAHVEHVKVIDYGPQMQWFRILNNDMPVGCLGLLHGDGHTQLKGVYVMPEMRGRGIGTQATEIALAWVNGPVEAAAVNPSWYHARGFKTVGRSESGFEIVRGATHDSSPDLHR